MSVLADGDWIVRTCDAIGLQPTDLQVDALSTYLAMLRRWNAAYNLTSVRDPLAMRSQHLADCMAVVPSIRRSGARGRFLDVGSGGGLPGVVIATLLPDVDVTCVDAVGKKAAFARQVAGTVSLSNLRSLHTRVENLPHDDHYDLITTRAFASLAETVRLTRSHLRRGGQWMAMKGRTPVNEMVALPPDIDVFHVEPLNVPGLGAERCLVWMRPASAF